MGLPFVVPAVCLGALWGYTAAGLVDTHTRLHTDAQRASSVARPAQDVLSRLQTERRLTTAWQASRTPAARNALADARKRTDAAVQEYRRSSPAGLDSATLRRSAKSLDDALVFLPERRKSIDGRTLSTTDAFQYFTDTIAHGTGLLTTSVRSGDGRFARGGAATASLVQITEMLSREDAVLAGALPGGGLSAATRSQFAQYLAVQREYRTGLNVGDLPGGTATTYARITDSAEFGTVNRVEEAVASGQRVDVSQLAASWPPAAAAVADDLQSLDGDSLADLAGSASNRADDALLKALAGTAGTLVALIGCAVFGLRARRSTLRRLSLLQEHTEELSGVRLPQLLARVESGERIDPAELAPLGRQPGDEVERLAAAIDQLGRVAAETAVRQSRGREGTEKVIGQLIRRTQILIHRLISLLDDLERKHEDSDLLKDIFRIDHLATRVRRHSESLVILSGSPPSRRISAPVSIIDVMRSAVAETELYTRVKVKNLPADRHLALAGRAVADVTHLLAELIENGTSFSPPDTQVFVSATKVGKGLVVHVEDHGLGMPQDMLDHANHLLANPPKLDMAALSEDPRLGHFVVSRLAERHKIKVELRESVYGGTLVVVLLPSALLEEVDSPVLDQLRSAASAAGVTPLDGPRPTVAAGSAAGQVSQGGSSAGLAGSLVGGSVGGGVGGSVGGGSVGGGMAGGPAIPAAGEVYSPVHARLPDHSGFPEYGGAGLLPAASDHPTPAANGPAEWAASPQQHPASHAPRETQAPPGYAGPEAARSGYPAPGAGRPGPQSAPPPPAPGDAQHTHRPLTTPQVLPHRTRGASLAQQLRREAEYTQGGPDGDQGVISPDASARAMIAIQEGLKRARMSEADEPGRRDGRPSDSRSSGANQP
ncbi:nitrate- and nitrite sensing domain-containing protein [Streptomyces sp. NBC_01476]|uniref:sensor histidine kinase n=1 Tax=Streptomyces sp. NBC_01476 TaxID=2903881 RepID=UPI002E2FB961|nr:nitrate- and nitrite sensing domain-containing protein [Streptomyces sp. NBC_01476]